MHTIKILNCPSWRPSVWHAGVHESCDLRPGDTHRRGDGIYTGPAHSLPTTSGLFFTSSLPYLQPHPSKLWLLLASLLSSFFFFFWLYSEPPLEPPILFWTFPGNQNSGLQTRLVLLLRTAAQGTVSHGSLLFHGGALTAPVQCSGRITLTLIFSLSWWPST